jgi:hypothetical protein|tara:strand:- start:950 stop:1096 length:147 start_codon:yes stop_codon:yes gene_type:complete
MVAQLADYASIIMALAIVNIVWQLDKASKMISSMNRFLHDNSTDGPNA